jgi:hypothetical protein
MSKAAKVITTSPTALNADLELAPVSVEYTDINEVLVSMKTQAGDTVAFTMRSAALVELVNMSVGLINNTTAQVFRDLEVL